MCVTAHADVCVCVCVCVHNSSTHVMHVCVIILHHSCTVNLVHVPNAGQLPGSAATTVDKIGGFETAMPIRPI